MAHAPPHKLVPLPQSHPTHERNVGFSQVCPGTRREVIASLFLAGRRSGLFAPDPQYIEEGTEVRLLSLVKEPLVEGF
jgi:hypothetical protein